MNICQNENRCQDTPIEDRCPSCRNEHRAELGQAAVHAFADAAGMRDELGYTDDLGSVVTDLLTDLIHFCDREEVNFETVLRRAQMHHETELSET